MRAIAVVLLAVMAAISCKSAPPAGPPRAPTRPFREVLFGTEVRDAYRWMEDPRSSEFQQWVVAQDAYRETVLGRLSGRKSLEAELNLLLRDRPSLDGVQRRGGRFFLQRRRGGGDTASLYVRSERDGLERLLYETTGTAAGPEVIDYVVPSLDGEFVVLGTSAGGSEATTLRVLDVRSGARVGATVDRTRFADASWCPSSCALSSPSFVYARHPAPSPATPHDHRYDWAQVYLRTLGASEPDRLVFSSEPSPGERLAADDLPAITFSPTSRWAVATVSHGVAREITLYAKPAARLVGDSLWRRVVDVNDAVVSFALVGDDLFLLTHADAPRFRVDKVRLGGNGIARRETVASFADEVIDRVVASANKVFLVTSRLGRARLYALGPRGPEPVALPSPASMRAVEADGDGSVTISVESHFRSTSWMHVSPEHVPAALAFGASTHSIPNLEVHEEWAVSADGTRVPMTILAPAGAPRDGSRPTWLVGYGAGGSSLSPTFVPAREAWFRRGGLVVLAHVRGGGELGAAWHEGALREKKPRAIEDFIACADRLVELRYTSSSTLGAYGRSAGGIVVGGAMARRPELFAAVIVDVGVSNALRGEVMPWGVENTKEFGSFRNELEFHGLVAQDAYLSIRDGIAYPAALLTAAENDPGVLPWQAGKMVARMQAASSSTRPVLLRFARSEGHRAGSSEQVAARYTDFFSFMLWQFGVPEFQVRNP